MTLDDEIRDHLARETQENIERGMSPEEARHAALRKFGNVTRVKEETREVWRRVWLDQLVQDIRYGCRTLRRSPGFAVVVIVTLALGIGMTTAIFSVVNAVLLRPLAYPNSNRLVWLDNYDPFLKHSTVGLADFREWRARARSFAAMAAYTYDQAAIATPAQSSRVGGVQIDGDFWRITGAHPALGRLFGPGEQGAIVLSWALFQRQFHGDPRAVGSQVSLDGRPAIIAGVLPKGFRFEFPAWWQATDPHPVEAYFPPPPDVGHLGGQAVAALKPGIPLPQAQAELEVLEKSIFYAQTNRPPAGPPPNSQVEPLQETITRSARPALLFLFAAGAFVLLMAAVNIANLLLSRAAVREREIAVRAAIGAGRMRVLRQLLTENLVLALAGGAAGIVVARAAIAALTRISPYAVPRLLEARIDARTLAFALLVSLAAGFLFGTGPALSLWRPNLHDSLKAGARASTGPQGVQLRRALVGLELALAMVLLAGAGLMLKSFWHMYARPAGFAPEKTLVMKLRLAGPAYAIRPGKERYFRELVHQLESAPGVEAAGIGNWFGFGGKFGFPNDPSPKERVVLVTMGSSGYLKALGMRMIKGRWLTDNDSADDALLNESMAHEAFGSVDPVGRTLALPYSKFVVRGVVSDLRYSQLDQPARPEVYAGLQQFLQFMAGGTIAVRTTGDPLALAPTLRKLISGIDPSQPVFNVETLEQALADSIAPRRFNLFLLGTFAAAALLLAIVGIYGAIAYLVAQRTREMGVRLALGAQRGRVILMVVREGMGVALAGIAVGLAAAFGLAPLMANLLYDVKPTDPWALGAVAAGLAIVGLAACLAPALKAASIDPVVALRYE